MDLDTFEINFSNTALLPRATAESLKAFPLFVCGGIATVGMEDPLDFKAVDQLRGLLNSDVSAVVCEREAIELLIERAYGITGGLNVREATPESAGPIELTTGKEPIVAAVNQIIAQGLDLGASDIHIGPDERALHLRYRVDGSLREVQGPSLDAHNGIIQRLKVMADLDLTQSRRPQDGKIRFSHQGRSIDVRVSLIPTVCGENAVLRLLSSAASIRGFSDLGFPQTQLTELQRCIEQPCGMLLVTGPTGSGKTTTLYTALKQLNAADVNIMTIEDPVEIRMPMIRQVQVNTQIGMTFAGALRSILRQDPDIVFVGEIRDEETARISIQAALTGHLVLSSLHTNDACGAIPRLRDLSCPSFAINAALLAVIAQRLVRRVCPDCSRADTPAPSLLERFSVLPGDSAFRRGNGCARCSNTGYKGRVGVYEMLTMNAAVRAAVEASETADRVQKAAFDAGMLPMWKDGLAKARLGQTTLEEVGRVVALALADDGRDEPTEARAAA